MKIQCSNCQTVYDLDDKKIPDRKIKFKCRKCQNHVYVNKKHGSAGGSSRPAQMECPKCGQQQAASDECVHCGMTLTNTGREVTPNSDRPSKLKLENESRPPEKQGVEAEMVNCPKCSFEIRADDLECLNCGIVLEKYHALEAKKKQAAQEDQQQAAESPGTSEEQIPSE